MKLGPVVLDAAKVLAAPILAFALVACSSQVKQAQAPAAEEFAESGGADMAAAEKTVKPVIKSADEMKQTCCQQCVDGLATDKTGDDPKKIPCADFTSTLSKECLEFFGKLKPPMMAADSKECAAAAPKAKE